MAGAGLFSFAGCESCNDANQGGGGGTTTEQPGGDNQGGGDNPIIGGDNKGDDTPAPPPVIDNNPVAGSVKITKAVGDLEAAYVTWEIDANAKWYNVYVKASSASTYATKLDAPLIRKYSTYFRADQVGLAKGSYDFKVVPVNSDGSEATNYASEAKSITVKEHQRMGYAFVNGTSSGAYNEDGTLKSNAVVLYVTNNNYKTVSVQASSDTVTGIDNILGEGYQTKKGANNPLCVRIVGIIGDGSKIDFKANGDLELKALDQGVTIEGIGSDATANGWGFHITNCSNIEIRNIGIMNMMGGTKDGIGYEGKCHHVWTHNCDFFYGHNWGGDQEKGDGALDTKSSSYATHSYNHFWDSGKCNLQGMKSESTDNCITYHHNRYDHSDSRHPRIRTCTVHIFNNYFDGNAKYGVGVTMGASAFVENNYFRSTSRMKPMMSSLQGTDIAHGTDGQTFSEENGGMIKAYGNHFEGPYELLTQNDTAPDNIDCYLASSRDEQVPSTYKTKSGGTTYNNFDTASEMYKYTVELPEQAKETVQKYAGRIAGGDLKHTFNNAVDDKDYKINTELASKVTSYKTSVIQIGEGAASTVGGNTAVTPLGGNPVTPSIDGTITSTFIAGKPSDSSITVSGNKKDAELVVHAYSETPLASGLKMESSTSVKFNLAEEMTLTLYFDGSAGLTVKIDGTKHKTTSVNGDLVVTVVLAAGAHEITKGDQMGLYYLTLVSTTE